MALSAGESGVMCIICSILHHNLDDVLQTMSRVKEKENTEAIRRTKPLSRPASKLRGSPARRGVATTNGDTSSTAPQTLELRTKKDAEEFILVGRLPA